MPTWATPAAAKFWVGAATAVAIAVLTALGDVAPRWLSVVAAALGALGVYLVKNEELVPLDPSEVQDPGYAGHVDPTAGAPTLDDDQGGAA